MAFTDYSSGGAGAGGLLQSSATGLSGAYTVTVGAGGALISGTGRATGNNGANSSLGALAVAIGGGGGASGTSTSTGVQGNSGGSAGGNSGNFTPARSGTAGQGNAGGLAQPAGGNYGGGGGGSGQVGQNAFPTSVPGYVYPKAGDGGNGLPYAAWTTATSTGDGVYYAGGGAGDGYQTSTDFAFGGTGGGGDSKFNANGESGLANTGGGGAAGGNRAGSYSTGSGGSGVVIIRYLGAASATGGTITSSGGYTYHTFTSSGTFTV